MPETKPTPPRSHPPETWRIERMVQKVPGHLGEEPPISPWWIVGLVVAVILVACLLLAFSNWGNLGRLFSSPSPTPTVFVTKTPRATVTPKPSPTDTPGPTAATVKYKVKAGDSLISIAAKYKTSVDAIRAANDLPDDTIRIGDTLIIPLPTPPGSAPPTPGNKTPTPTPQVQKLPTDIGVFTPTALVFKPSPTSANTATPVGTPGVVRYTVKSGDTLISIAATFSTTVQSIILINGLDGPFIRAGAEITVPFGVWQPTDTPTVYVAPSVTPTPVFAYDAPQLLWPPDGALFAASDKITLMWTAPGLLTLNEFYVVRIRCTANAQERQTPYEVRQGTALNLDKPPCPLPTQFTWQVLVVSQTEGGAPIASSPLSATRMFGWE